MSRSLLAVLGDHGEVMGLPWHEPGQWQPISLKSAVARVLCERHNSALAPLDREAAGLFAALLAIDAHVRAGRPCPGPLALVSGHAIERWMLKTLIGLIAAGGLARDGQRYEDRTIKLEWIEILFGRRPWPRHWRLEALHSSGDALQLRRGFGFKALEGSVTGAPVGMVAVFGGLRFILATVPPADPTIGRVARPSRILFRRDGREMVLDFGWREDRGHDIRAEWGRSPPTCLQTDSAI